MKNVLNIDIVALHFVGGIMKYKKIYIILIILTILVEVNKYKKINKNNIKYPVEYINCNIGNRKYEYEIFYSEENNEYMLNSNETLLTDLKHQNIAVLENNIINIFENKSGICYVENNMVIELSLNY